MSKGSDKQKKADLKNRIIVALDTPSLDHVKQLTKKLEGLVSVYKIGFELFTAHGWEAVNWIRSLGAEVFLDLKFHDIPNTVSKAALVASEHDVLMFNVHASGGLEMMKKTRQAVDERSAITGKKPLVLAVTVLTSLSEKEIQSELGISRKLPDQVLELARLAKKAGLDGVVCSPQEIEKLRQDLGPDFVLVTPGVRPEGSAKDDQKRTLTPREAFELGASYLVIGRPITGAESPRKAIQQIHDSL